MTVTSQFLGGGTEWHIHKFNGYQHSHCITASKNKAATTVWPNTAKPVHDNPRKVLTRGSMCRSGTSPIEKNWEDLWRSYIQTHPNIGAFSFSDRRRTANVFLGTRPTMLNDIPEQVTRSYPFPAVWGSANPYQPYHLPMALETHHCFGSGVIAFQSVFKLPILELQHVVNSFSPNQTQFSPTNRSKAEHM